MIEFTAVAEPEPGPRWRARFDETWPAFRRWYLRDGDAARPSYATARRMLETHMPELVPVWERLVELADGGDVVARMLSLYDPPPVITGCSQAVLARGEPLLVRNYDFHPDLLDAVIYATALTGRHVLGMRDCLWGLLDGVNDAGLTVSLAFGGRQAIEPGFAVPLVVRYLLEVCGTTAEAADVLARLPVQAAYNLTMVDRRGAAVTAVVSPDRPLVVREPYAANHPATVEWDEHARATASVEREQRMLALLADPATTEDGFLDAFLVPPLHNTAYEDGFGTLYTAAYRPADGSVEYRWPSERWRQSLDRFEEGSRAVRLTAAHPAPDSG